MMDLRISTLLCMIALCSGSGGGGHVANSPNTVEESNFVKILQIPKSLQLSCNTTQTDGTKVDVYWYKDDNQLASDDRITANFNGTLIINPTEIDDVGIYKCEPTTGGNAFSEIKVVMLSYTKLPKSTTAIEGDTLTLTCEVSGNPVPVVTWTKDNETLVETDRVHFKTEKGPTNSTISISEVNQSDRGLYTCSFDNTDGEMVFHTSSNVRVKDLYAALWPFLGIVLEVVILCLVIFIYEKRRSNVEFEESDTDTGKAGR